MKRTISFFRKHFLAVPKLERLHQGLLGPCASKALNQNSQTCFLFALEPGKASSFSDWQPEPYNCEEEKAKGAKSEAPCPEDFERHLVDQGRDAEHNLYINCIATDLDDRRALDGTLDLTYYPRKQGMALGFFEEEDIGSGNVISPLVAIQISPTRAYVKDQIVEIECKAYFKGVRHVHGEGVVKFKVQFNNASHDPITDYESYDEFE